MLVCLNACYVLVDLVSKFVLHSLVFIIRLVYSQCILCSQSASFREFSSKFAVFPVHVFAKDRDLCPLKLDT